MGKKSENRELPIALRAAYLSLHRNSDAVFAEFGVTADQFVLLATLSKGVALTQRELANRMNSDPSTVRAMLVLLERSGLVERKSHPTDSRARMVSLTPQGKKTFQSLWIAGEPIRNKMVDKLSTTELAQLIALLNRIAFALNQ